MAIYNLTIVELNFPVALYKKLLKRKPTLDDLKELMPDVGRSVYTHDTKTKKYIQMLLSAVNKCYTSWKTWSSFPLIEVTWKL